MKKVALVHSTKRRLGEKYSASQTLESFLSRVSKTEKCWLWLGGKNEAGYGSFYENGKSIKAHRYSFRIFNGPLITGLVVMHSCDTPMCVNPNHLSLGTHKQNSQDASIKGRLKRFGYAINSANRNQRERDKCKRGHDLTKPENVYTYPKHNRRGSVCRLCKRIERLNSVRRFRERQKGKIEMEVINGKEKSSS